MLEYFEHNNKKYQFYIETMYYTPKDSYIFDRKTKS